MPRNILIISFHFPPSPGVGGRRWAKFAKYLSHRDDIQLTVVSAKSTIKSVKSSYEKDVMDASFEHVVLSPRYPIYLQNMEFPKKGILASIGFRLQRLFVMLFAKGNYFDYTIFWKKYFSKEIPEIIRRKKINRVILSGPPFRYVYYALALKEVFKDIELIYDSRDPWCDPNHPPTVSKKRHDFEAQAEVKVLSGVDKIIAVSPFQKGIMESRCKNHAPIFVLRNGFDLQDVPATILEKKSNPNEIVLTHFGVMHGTKDYYWKAFAEALLKLKSSNRAVFDKLKIEFIGLCPAEVETAFRETGVKMVLHGFQNMINSYNLLNQADIALWFKYDGSPGDYATKFGDYISLKKFIWTFSVKGEVTDHVEANNIGKVFFREDQDLVNTICKALEESIDSEKRKFNSSYKAKDLEIGSLTNQLVDILYPPVI